MRTTNNTILITGGSAGIGYEIARLLAHAGNTLIITGRNAERLHQAAAALPNTTAIVSDVADATQVDKLVNRIRAEFPELNMVINNAGAAQLYSLADTDAGAMDKAGDEIHTNYLSVIRLNEKLLPLLIQQTEAAIVNVSSVVAYVPGSLATYSASKAALHSYTQSLRFELRQRFPHVAVFELMPPLVNTQFSKPIGGERGIAPSAVAERFVQGLTDNEYEIRVGFTAELYRLFLSDPDQAFAAMHQPRREEYA